MALVFKNKVGDIVVILNARGDDKINGRQELELNSKYPLRDLLPIKVSYLVFHRFFRKFFEWRFLF